VLPTRDIRPMRARIPWAVCVLLVLLAMHLVVLCWFLRSTARSEPPTWLESSCSVCVVFQAGPIEQEAQLLVRSIRLFHPRVYILAGVYGDNLTDETKRFLKTSVQKVVRIEHNHPQYLHANKIYLLRELVKIAVTPYVMFVDSDMLLCRPLPSANLSTTANISAVFARFNTWGEHGWDAVLARAHIAPPPPDATFVSLELLVPMRLPYCNAGLLLLRRETRFPQRWLDLMLLFLDDDSVPDRFPWLDQITLALAVTERLAEFRALPGVWNDNHYGLDTVFWHYHQDLDAGRRQWSVIEQRAMKQLGRR